MSKLTSRRGFLRAAAATVAGVLAAPAQVQVTTAQEADDVVTTSVELEVVLPEDDIEAFYAELYELDAANTSLIRRNSELLTTNDELQEALNVLAAENERLQQEQQAPVPEWVQELPPCRDPTYRAYMHDGRQWVSLGEAHNFVLDPINGVGHVIRELDTDRLLFDEPEA